jgi:hypothetical protein
MSSLMKMLIASVRGTDLSMEDIAELMGMQSYAVLENRISVISVFSVSWVEAGVPIGSSNCCSAGTLSILHPQCPLSIYMPNIGSYSSKDIIDHFPAFW